MNNTSTEWTMADTANLFADHLEFCTRNTVGEPCWREARERVVHIMDMVDGPVADRLAAVLAAFDASRGAR